MGKRRDAKRLRAKAKADPAVRTSWIDWEKRLFIGFQVAGVGPNASDKAMYVEWWREIEDGPPNRQELEWLRAVLALRASVPLCPPDWLLAMDAMQDAIEEILPGAAFGPSKVRYP